MALRVVVNTISDTKESNCAVSEGEHLILDISRAAGNLTDRMLPVIVKAIKPKACRF